jgi:transcriptional regulator with XRE-family HTH domain
MSIILLMKANLPPEPVAARLARLGAAVAAARLQRDWSQIELAQRLGTSRRTLVNLEAGAPGVALGTALHAAWLLNVSLDGAAAAAVPEQPFRRRSRRVAEPDLDF